MKPALAHRPLLHSLPSAVAAALASIGVEHRFAANELLLEGGIHAEWIHVIDEGLVREYYVTADGHEHTRAFVAEGAVTGSLLDLTSSAPSVTWIQALEPTQTLGFRFRDFNALATKHAELESLARRLAEALAVRKTMREYEMLALCAAERLARWRLEHPGLDARITRRLLASYLGITPVHLSRISARGGRVSTALRREMAPRLR